MAKRRHRRIERHKGNKWAILICSLCLLFVTTVFVTQAFFSINTVLYTDDGQTTYFRMGMELNTFFDKISGVAAGTNLGIVCHNPSGKTDNKLTTTSVNGVTYYTYNPSAKWGTASNPYLISRVNHLQNLYVLQNIGYFTSVTGNNADAGKQTEENMPYFLVCNPGGTPVSIDGSGRTFEYIGTSEYPFIGYVGGAFTSGTVSVGGKSSDQSAIYNVTAQTTDDEVDVGLFGYVGYLGNESTAQNDMFTGAASTIRDLLLYDVKVSVTEKSAWDVITSHLFSFTRLADEAQSSAPHENHHIGILAGHVDHATVEYISVYYSSNDIAAIDVNFKTASGNTAPNFKSVSGILGFVNNMNAEQTGGKILLNGTNNDDIEVTGGGVGSGGGLESGSGRGYVTAAEIYQAYDDSGEIVKCTITYQEQNPDGSTYTTDVYKYGLKIIADINNPITVDGETTYYTLNDRVTPVLIREKSGSYVARIVSTYQNFFGTEQTSYHDWAEFVIYNMADSTYYYYKSGSSSLTAISSDKVETTGVSLRYAAKYSSDSGAFTRLCTQYERSRIGSSITGWSQYTDRYYFYDGVFTFALSDPSDTIEKTWDGEADTFYVGADDASQWKTNASAGNKAVVSYIKQITTAAELKTLQDAGKKVYLIYETQNDAGQTVEYLVTLAKNSAYSAGNGDDACFTDCTELQFVDAQMSEELKATVASGTLGSPIAGLTAQQLVANWDSYRILNVGSSNDADMSLTKLSQLYCIDVNYIPRAADTTYKDEYGNTFGNTSTVTVTPGSGISESLQHTWDGFIAFETTDLSGTWLYYNAKLNYFYVTASGKGSVLKTSDKIMKYSNASYNGHIEPYQVSGVSSKGTQYGVSVYAFTSNGTTYQGPILYLKGGNYYTSWDYDRGDKQVVSGSGSAVSLTNGKYVTNYTVTHHYFTAEISETGTVYKYQGTGAILPSAPTVVENGAGEAQTVVIGGQTYTLYTDGTNQGILLSMNTSGGSFAFSSVYENTKYTLRMLHRRYSSLTNRYSIICSDDALMNNAAYFTDELNRTPSLANSTEATVTPTGDGRFYISYQINGNTRYLAFGDSVAGASGPCFHGTSTTSDACKIYIYAVEGSQDINYGHVTYYPSDNTGTTYSAAEYVLWPNSVYDGTDATVSYKPVAGSTSTDPTYSVKSLASLYSSGWQTASGGVLSQSSLSSVFSLGDGISNIDIVSLWGGESATNFNSEYIKAPIGTTGEEAYIPTGCVAFRVNEANTNNRVRVIVSVPVSKYFYGQEVDGVLMNPDEIDYSEDYYFCMWSIGEAGSSSNTTITVDNCVAAFEIPRSNPYEPGSSASDGDYYTGVTTTVKGAAAENTIKKYINITANDGSTKRSYLNGSRVLVAYEFSATNVGVYVLGSNHECSIVYFSADSSASGGQDISGSFKMGTIDFVYDNGEGTSGNKILTVKDADPATDGNMNFGTYYYPTLCLLYTDNSNTGTNGPLAGDPDIYNNGLFANINDFAVYVRRLRASGKAQISWQSKNSEGGVLSSGKADADYIQLVRYNLDADQVDRSASGTR